MNNEYDNEYNVMKLWINIIHGHPDYMHFEK